MSAAAVAKAWARSLDLGAASRKVFLAAPKNLTEAGYPIVTVKRVGGAVLPDLPVDVPRLQFEVYGRRGQWAEAEDVASRLIAALDRAAEAATPAGVLVGATVEFGPLPQHDEEAGRPVFVVGALATIRATRAA